MSSKFRRYLLSSLMIGMVSTPMSLSAGPSPPADAGQPTTLVLDVALDAGTLSYSRADAATSGPQRGDNSSGGATLRLTFQLIRLNPQDNSAISAALKQGAAKQKMRDPRRPR
jgi:hypothetical protein